MDLNEDFSYWFFFDGLSTDIGPADSAPSGQHAQLYDHVNFHENWMKLVNLLKIVIKEPTIFRF